MKIRDSFYKNVAFGFTICFIFQIFLNVGGVVKFIPSTGVTLPLVSYGVSSVVSTLIIFGIIQGICVLENSGVDKNVRQKNAVRSEWQSGEQWTDNKKNAEESRPKKTEKQSRRQKRTEYVQDTDEFWGE